MTALSAFFRQKLFRKKGIPPIFFMMCGFLILTPQAIASPFTFQKALNSVVGGSKQAISSNIIREGAVAITGSYQVDVAFDFPANGEIDAITVYGDGGAPFILNEANPTKTALFSAYNFTTNGSKLNIEIMTDAEDFGTAALTFTVNTGIDTVGTAVIDTRLQGSENIALGFKYAEDPIGGLINFAPINGGVTVSESRMTGLIWSEIYGWIDLQPPGEKVLVDVISPTMAKLSGKAWNDVLGYIEFGEVATEGGGTSPGVYIDGTGFFHGTAWTQGGFGYVAFGDYMPLNDAITQISPTVTDEFHKNNWAKTSWTFTGNNEPTITMKTPVDESEVPDRTPLFTFDIDDEDGHKVGYLITVERETAPGVWGAFDSFQSTEALETVLYSGTHDFERDFDPGSYRWRMKAFDEYSSWSLYTGYYEFTIVNGSPGFELITPGNLSSYSDTRTPEFTFTINEPDGDLIRYQVQVSNNPGFAPINIVAASPLSGYLFADTLLNGGTPFSYTPAVSLPGGTLYWRLYVFDEYDEPANLWATTYHEFVIVNATTTITNPSLRDNNNNEIIEGGATFDTNPTIVWTSNDVDTGPTGIMTTTIEIYTQPGWNPGNLYTDFPVHVDHQRGTNEYTLPTLPVGVYYLRIRTCDEDSDCDDWICDAEDGCDTWDWSFAIETRTRFGNIGTVTINSLNPRRTFLPDTGDTDADNNQYIWNSLKGWIDLNPEGGGVIVEERRVVGYAWSEYLGWIRMNCEAANVDSGLLMSDTCATNDYGVINTAQDTHSTLSGKALVEKTGNFIYFDQASYNDDFEPDTAEEKLKTEISCDDTPQGSGDDEYVTKGHFSGWAWSTDSGWISLGWEEFIDHSGNPPMDDADAQDVFPITEWSCGEALDPTFINTYKVISARDDEDIKYPIAQKSASNFAGELICDQDDPSYNPTSHINVHRVNSDGTDDVELDYMTDFEIGCEAGDPGKLYLTIKNDAVNKAAQTAGLLRITGTVADNQGKSVSELDNTGADFTEEQILQIVSAEPDITNPSTLTLGGFDDALRLADGIKNKIYTIQLYDAYNNPVYEVHQYEDGSKPLIKNVSFRVIFHDEVKLDQVDDEPSIKKAVNFIATDNVPNANVALGLNYDIYESVSTPAHIYTLTPTQEDSYLLVTISSRAPTTSDDDNPLTLHRIEATVEQAYDVTNTELEVGQIETADKTKIQEVGETIAFQPIITAEFVQDFNDFGNVLEEPDFIDINLINNDPLISRNSFDWLALLRTKHEAGSWGGTAYRGIYLDWPGGASPDSGPTAFFAEVAAPPSNLPLFRVAGSSYFPDTLSTYLQPFSGTPWLYIQNSMLPQIPAGGELTVRLTATPHLEGFPNGAEYPQLTQAIALPVGNRLVKYDLLSTTSNASFNILTVAVTGSIHGDAVNQNVIVGKDDATAEFAKVGKIYSRPDVRKMMYQNYHTLTGNSIPKAIGGVVTGTNISKVVYNDYIAFNNARTLDGHGIQGNKVIWLEREANKDGLTVVLGDDDDSVSNTLSIPEDLGPITLLVRGGNLYIRDNIITGPGTTLGIIMLRAEGEHANGREGNIFIDPSVTRIEAAMYADGSVMSAKDGRNDDLNDLIEDAEIFDGFSEAGDIALLNNQLLIKGSIVSQNIVGKASEQTIPSDDVWLDESVCDQGGDGGTNECEGNDDNMMKLAKRYDLNYLRRYRLVSSGDNDPNGNGIRPQQDCYELKTTGCSISLSQKKIIDSVEYDLKYNPLCQNDNGINLSPLPPECRALPAALKSEKDGTCAAGTPWCGLDNRDSTENFFNMSCTDNDNINFCDANDPNNVGIKNKKMGAALIIEYDPQLKQLTPVGMNTPAFIEVGE